MKPPAFTGHTAGSRLRRAGELGRSRLGDLHWDQIVLPIAFFGVSGYWFASFLIGPSALGYDARLYAFAARAMIEGQDPWRVERFGGNFAGPPTTLMPYLPFAYLPEQLVAAIWIIGSLVLAAYILRRLGLPPWWLAFPPLFFPIVTGSVEVLMVAILVSGGRLTGLAAVLKPYAALPLVAERRWSALVVAGVVTLVTVPLLPWGTFVADLPHIASRLQIQSFTSNAFGNVALMLIAGVALLSMGVRRALWLATPVLWPSPQIYYAAMTLPVITPLIALCWSLDFPGAMVLGVVLAAISHRLKPGDPLMVRGGSNHSRHDGN
jgi:hypothetical protein